MKTHLIQFLRISLLLLGAAILGACTSPVITDYAGQKPSFELERYFTGRVVGHGMFSERSGKVLRRFTVVIDGNWVGNQGTLNEAFVYDDGEKQQRVWHLQKLADGSYSGTAGDIVGLAQGSAAGSAFYWRYTLSLPVQGQVYEVQMDDWMHQIDERTVLNRTVMSKLGLRVGEVTLAFSRP